MFDSILSILYVAALKFTPTTKDEEAIRKLQEFLKAHPPLLDQLYNCIMMAVKGKHETPEFKKAMLDLLVDLLSAKQASIR